MAEGGRDHTGKGGRDLTDKGGRDFTMHVLVPCLRK